MGVGVMTEGIELPSVGNTLTLHDTAFIEAFNLKAAFEFDIQNRNTVIDIRIKK